MKVFAWLLQQPLFESPPPRIRFGELYTAAEIIAALGIGKPTLQLWMDSGLPYTQKGTKAAIFIGDDIIAFMRAHQKIRFAEA